MEGCRSGAEIGGANAALHVEVWLCVIDSILILSNITPNWVGKQPQLAPPLAARARATG